MNNLPGVNLMLALAAGFLFLVANSHAQEYPTKPIRLIVPISAGSTHDLVSRIVGEEMRKFIGQSIVIENKPGAGQMLGYEYVTKQAPADGYTATIVINSILALAPVTIKNLRFDPLKDLTPVSGLVEARHILVSPSKVPWTSFREMTAYSKANPGKLNYGSSAQSIRIIMEVINQKLQLDIMRIDYNGGGPILQAIMSGDVHTAILAESAINAGGNRIQVLATTGERRRAPLLDVPTFAELGFTEFSGLRFALSVRTGTPKIAMQKLYNAATLALEQPELKARLNTAYLDIWQRPGDVTYQSLLEEAKLYEDVAKKLGLELQ